MVASSCSSSATFNPVAVRVKNDIKDAKKFYYLDWEQHFINDRTEGTGHLEHYKYDTEVVREFRQCFEECLVAAFGCFTMKEVTLSNKKKISLPSCDLPAECLLDTVMKRVSQIFSHRIDFLKREAAVCGDVTDVATHLEKVIDTLSTGWIAEICVHMTQTFRVNKNWNSHGAKVGAAICEAASVIAMLTKTDLNSNFRYKIPRGRVLTGQMHGSEDNVHMEYMLAQYAKGHVTMTESNLFDPIPSDDDSSDGQQQETPADRIFDLADSWKLPDGTPKARPTRAHCFDFMCTYRGVHILDGECKDVKKDEDEQVLLSTALSQFAHRDSALALLTTSTSMDFYKMIKDVSEQCPTVYRSSLPTYKMGSTTIYIKNKTELQLPPGCASSLKKTTHTNVDPKVWKGMAIQKRSLITTLLHAVDILVSEIHQIDLDAVQKQKKASFQLYPEPSYWDTGEQQRVIESPERFILQPEFFGCRSIKKLKAPQQGAGPSAARDEGISVSQQIRGPSWGRRIAYMDLGPYLRMGPEMRRKADEQQELVHIAENELSNEYIPERDYIVKDYRYLPK